MKKRFLLLMFIILIVLLAQNGKQDENNYTMSNLKKFYYSHSDVEYEKKLKEIKLEIDEKSFDELSQQYEDLVQLWRKEQSHCAIENLVLSSTNRNNKKYNNIDLNIDIYYVQEAKKISKNMLYNELINILQEKPFGYYKIHCITINLYRSNIDTEKPYASREYYINWQTDIEKQVFVVE